MNGVVGLVSGVGRGRVRHSGHGAETNSHHLHHRALIKIDMIIHVVPTSRGEPVGRQALPLLLLEGARRDERLRHGRNQQERPYYPLHHSFLCVCVRVYCKASSSVGAFIVGIRLFTPLG